MKVMKFNYDKSTKSFSKVKSFSLENLTEKDCLDKLTFRSPQAYYNCMNSKSYGFYACSKADSISNYGDTSKAKYIYDGCPDNEHLKVSSVRVPKSKGLLKSYESWINAFLKYNRVRSAEIQLWDEDDNNVKDYIEVVHMIHGDSEGCDCIGSYKGNKVFIRMKVVKS